MQVSIATNQNLDTATTTPLCFFGLGILFESCYSQLILAVGREPDILCDNAPDKWGRNRFGIPCISPEKLAAYDKNTRIVICVRNYEAIYQQLTLLGFNHVRVACFDRGYNILHTIKRLPVLPPPQPPAAISMAGRWTLITGAAQGIGKQLALAMARLGSNLVLHARQTDHLSETKSACEAEGVKTVCIAAELSLQTELDHLLDTLKKLEFPIDVLFNNAGISPLSGGGRSTFSANTFHATYAVNTLAPIQLSLALIPGMIQRKFGRIINITSSIHGRPEEMAYACSKAALDKFVYDLQPELDGTGVMLSLADPGWLQTNMGGPYAKHPVEHAIPGLLLGALIDGNVGARYFCAQDYVGLTLEAAISKAHFIEAFQV